MRGRPKKKFLLYRKEDPKKDKSEWIYYVIFKDKETNKRILYKSSGCTSEKDAEEWVYDFLENNDLKELTKNKKIKDPTSFEVYTKNFFIYDLCPYILSEKVNGKRYTRYHAKTSRINFEAHILPYFKSYKLHEISEEIINNFKVHLRNKPNKRNKDKSLSLGTCNRILQIIFTIMKFAWKIDKKIQVNPCARITTFSEKGRHEKRGILSINETISLFDEKNINKIWENKIYYAINLLSAFTGMRQGECLGLKKKNILEDRIIIENGYNRIDKIKETKTYLSRVCPIPAYVFKYLNEIMADKSPDSLVFAIKEDKHTPIAGHKIRKSFYDALKIGLKIDKTKRNEKRIVFHSFRHFLISYLRNNKIDVRLVEEIVGHSNGTTNDGYFHPDYFNLTRYADIIKLQKELAEEIQKGGSKEVMKMEGKKNNFEESLQYEQITKG